MVHAQMITSPEIAQFRWKQRLLLIVSYDTDFINKQLQVISTEHTQKDWEERKLKWIVISPDRYQIEGETWTLNSKLYQLYKKEEMTGYCMLVGLDGSIKEKSKGMVSIQAIFDLIDIMPMRKSELKQQPK